MNFALTRIAPPTVLPISLADMKDHLRVDFDADDDLITALIAAATERAENVTGRSLCSQQWQLTLDGFPREHLWRYAQHTAPWHEHHTILLPRNPVVSLDSVAYTDPTGGPQTVSPNTCQLDLASAPSRLRPAVGSHWPATQRCLNAVTIKFTTGYAENAVPPTVVQAIRLMVGSWYENREDVTVGAGNAQTLPRAAEYILAMHKVNALGYSPVGHAAHRY